MRFVVEVLPGGGGRVEGTVLRDGHRPAAFCGWLELLRLLEPDTSTEPPTDEVGLPGPRFGLLSGDLA